MRFQAKPTTPDGLWDDTRLRPPRHRRKLTGTDDDLRYREAVWLYARVQPGSVIVEGPILEGLRGSAQSKITEASQKETSNVRRAQLLNLLGLISMDRFTSDPANRTAIVRERSDSSPTQSRPTRRTRRRSSTSSSRCATSLRRSPRATRRTAARRRAARARQPGPEAGTSASRRADALDTARPALRTDGSAPALDLRPPHAAGTGRPRSDRARTAAHPRAPAASDRRRSGAGPARRRVDAAGDRNDEIRSRARRRASLLRHRHLPLRCWRRKGPGRRRASTAPGRSRSSCATGSAGSWGSRR